MASKSDNWFEWVWENVPFILIFPSWVLLLFIWGVSSLLLPRRLNRHIWREFT